MPTHRQEPLDRTAAERLLSAGPAVVPAGSERLAGLLAAAAAPARPEELTGERAAVAAFRAERLVPVAPLRRRSVIKSSVARILTAKAAAAFLAVTTVGGVAAAASGALSHPSHPTPPASQPPGEVGAMPGGGYLDTPAASRTGGSSPTSHPGVVPSPSLVGLCRAYTAGVASNPGRSLDNPAFGALIAVAGGRANVATYCQVVLRAAPGRGPTAHPTGKPTAHPTGKPSVLPTPRGTGKPSVHPTGKPTVLPTPRGTGKPTALPTH